MTIYALLAVPLGYLLGSIPSAYIVGRLAGNTDMRTEGDGRISAAAVYRRVGVIPYLLVILMDVGKGAAAIYIAQVLADTLAIALLTGLAAVIGHDWSIFLKFKGGMGATVIYGVLASLAIRQFLIAGVITVIPFLATRKSGLSTGILIITLSLVLLLQKTFLDPEIPLILAFYPLMLITFMLLKRLQIRKTVSISA